MVPLSRLEAQRLKVIAVDLGQTAVNQVFEAVIAHFEKLGKMDEHRFHQILIDARSYDEALKALKP